MSQRMSLFYGEVDETEILSETWITTNAIGGMEVGEFTGKKSGRPEIWKSVKEKVGRNPTVKRSFACFVFVYISLLLFAEHKVLRSSGVYDTVGHDVFNPSFVRTDVVDDLAK